MTQQGLRQASARALSGFATETNYNENLLRLFDASGVPAGTFNERQLRWLNGRLDANYTNLDEAMQVYAESQGAYNWSGLGALENTVRFTRSMPVDGTYTRTGAATGQTAGGLIEAFAADVPQQTDRGLALEVSRTNLLLNSTFAGGGAAPTSWTRPVANGTSAPATSTVNPAVTAYAQTATAQRPFLSQTVNVGTASVYQFSIIVEAVTGGLVAQDLIQLTSPPATALSAFVPCSANPSGLFNGTVVPGVLVIQLTTLLIAGTVLCRAGIGCSANATGTARFSTPQIELGTYTTSPIITTTGTATRGLPVLIETVPAGRTKALLTYADATTTLISGLTPGDSLEYAETVITANKGRFGVSELVSRVWQA